MSSPRHGTDVRGPAARRRPGPPATGSRHHTEHRDGRSAGRRLPLLPPSSLALSGARTMASLLVLSAGLLYTVAAVRGVGWLLSPPPEMVTRAADSGTVVTPTRMAAVYPGASAQVEVLLRPLAVTGTALAGLLLAWSGCRGLRSRHDQRHWRRVQGTGLAGFAIGMVAFAVGLVGTGGTAALDTGYAGASWLGLEPLRPSAALALLVITVMLTVPRRGSGDRNPAGPAGRAPQTADNAE